MRTYNHVQTSASDTWVVQHNLACPVTTSDTFIDISGSMVKILPESVVHTDNNTLTITFSTARTGVARVLGN